MCDLVLRGGRVLDPETGLDAVSDVGIVGDQIVSVSEVPLDGRRELDVRGLVVAPGFIDLHSHGQSLAETRLQALDGVTTALELEAGAARVSLAYERAAAEGRPLTYGYSASWPRMRGRVVAGAPRVSDGDGPLDHLGEDAWRERATATQTACLLDLMGRELADGALGIGILLGYAPDTEPEEYVALATLAAAVGVPTF